LKKPQFIVRYYGTYANKTRGQQSLIPDRIIPASNPSSRAGGSDGSGRLYFAGSRSNGRHYRISSIRGRHRGLDLRRGLLGQGELKMMEEDLEIFLGLGVAGEHDFTAIGGGQVDVE
jgi:hypothetical protein